MDYRLIVPTGKKLPPAPLTRAIGLILRDLTDDPARGISQSEVGRRNVGRVGYVSQPLLSRVINGQRGIDIDQLNALCEIFEISIVDVIERAEQIVAEQKIPLAPITRIRPNVARVDQDANLRAVAHTPKYAEEEVSDDQYE